MAKTSLGKRGLLSCLLDTIISLPPSAPLTVILGEEAMTSGMVKANVPGIKEHGGIEER